MCVGAALKGGSDAVAAGTSPADTATAAAAAAPSLFARWAESAEARAASDARGAAGAEPLSDVERWALHLVNAEFERSKRGGWRRLFPCKRSADYLPFLEPTRAFHRLPFDV